MKKYKCLYCGRILIGQIPHNCKGGNYRKHHLKFKEMGNVYLVYESNFNDPELLSVDYNFFNQEHPGDYVRVGNENHQILQKIYDPQEMDLYINVSSKVKFEPSNVPLVYEQKYVETCKQSILLAVKQVKKDWGIGLKEAKDYIDELRAKYNV